MALGDTSKALIIMSKNKGWDPTVIPGVGSIAPFNKAPNPWESGDQSVGNLPDGTPNGWPDTHGPPVTPTPGTDEIDWKEPGQRDNVSRATKNSDPFAGMGGSGG